MIYIIGYIVSVVVSYSIFRCIYKVMKNRNEHNIFPLNLVLLFMILPFLNVFISLLILITELEIDKVGLKDKFFLMKDDRK